MLQINIPDGEAFDESRQKFVKLKGGVLQLEHSLISLSKWESKHKKPFLSPKEKLSDGEMLDYFKCMMINNADPKLFNMLSIENIKEISDYINDQHTATWFSEDRQKKQSSEIVTSELIYFWMVSYNIPFECQKWHLGRLITLIRICGIKNQPSKKMSTRDAMRQQSSLNAARRAAMHSKG